MKDKINTIIAGDCIKELKKIPSCSVDLIFADPPYNLQLQKTLYRNSGKKFEGVEDDWDKFSSIQEYDRFCLKWLTECRRVLKNNGTIWTIGSFQNIFRLGAIMQNLNYWILNDILWIKSNPVPNFKGTRFNNAHETLIWASKNKNSSYTFHYKTMKCFNDDKQMRSDWYIPICSGAERLKDENGDKAHSTQKPAELLHRIILSTSKENDIILDPFFGSGTTGAVAKRLRRKFIGIEKEEKYIKMASKRIDNITPLDSKYLKLELEIKPPRIPFGNLIEKGIIKIGEKIYSKDKKYYGVVQADASISNSIGIGSIHSLSAKLLDKPSNNGWTFWYVKRNDSLLSIHQLRENYIKRYGIQ